MAEILYVGSTIAQRLISEELVMWDDTFGARCIVVFMIRKTTDFAHRGMICDNANQGDSHVDACQ
jgi:hypothetical protein